MTDEPPKDSTRSAGTGRDRKPELTIWSLGGTGVELAGAVAVLALLGWWADRKFGTSPWLLLVGAFMGIVGGLYKLWRVGKQFFDR